MPRVSRAVRIGVPTSRSFTRSNIKVAGVVGRPSDIIPQQTFPVVLKPSYFKAGIRRLQKVDVSKGITMPEANALPFIAGVVAPGTSTYGGQRILLQHPRVPSAIGGQTRKLIAAPSPTNRAGVRSPYNQKVRVGKTASNKRFGRASGPSYTTGTGRK